MGKIIRNSLFLWFFMDLIPGQGQVAGQVFFRTQVFIEMGKKDFLVRQPVWINIRIVNEDEEGPRLLNCPLSRFFVIQDKTGNRFYPETESGAVSDYQRLPEGEKRDRVNILSSYFRIGARSPHLNPGFYRVWFEWNEPGREPLLSDTLTFNVIHPEGEDKKAFGLLQKGDNQYRLKNIEESDAFYQRLVEKYPHSVYAAPALELLLRNHINRFGAEDRRVRERTVKKLFEEYPDADFNMDRALYELEEVYRGRKDVASLKRYLEKLLPESSGTVLYEKTEQMLMRLQRE